MPLYMDVEGLRCFQATEVETWRDDVTDPIEDVARWQALFFAANGKTDANSAEQVAGWLNAAERISFQQIAAHLLNALMPHYALSEIDMVVVAHWTPDCVMGFSVTNYVLHHLQAEHAYAFAISDCGRSAPFQAIALIDRYLPAERGKALLLVVDQPLLLHPSKYLDSHPAQPSGAVLLLDRQPGRFELRPGPSITRHTEEEKPAIAALRGDTSRLSAAPFYALLDYLSSADHPRPVWLASDDDAEHDGLLVTPREAA